MVPLANDSGEKKVCVYVSKCGKILPGGESK